MPEKLEGLWEGALNILFVWRVFGRLWISLRLTVWRGLWGVNRGKSFLGAGPAPEAVIFASAA